MGDDAWSAGVDRARPFARVTIEPSATVREAVALIGRERVGRLLVSHTAHAMPEGVVAELDLLGV